MGALTDDQVAAALQGGEWRREGAEIVREWRLMDFGAAIAFVNRVAEAADSADHHPDIRVHGYNRVELRLTTHASGGLTQRDFELARAIDALN